MYQKEREELIETFFQIDPLTKEQFLKLRQTLSRIGLPSKKDQQNILWQTCHVLHKKGRYFIVHFKQMFLLDGKGGKTDFTEEDEDRLQFIVNLLEQWGLVRSQIEIDPNVNAKIVVIPHKEKHLWSFKSKYSIGSENEFYRRESSKK